MSDQKLNQIEKMLSDLILTVGTLKAYFEEETEENKKRFEQIDQRFEQIDQRFEQIDQRFEQIDQRFERIDQRFERIDQRFEQIDQRFDEVLKELRVNRREHDYMATRLFRAEMEMDNLKLQLSES